MNGRPGPRVAGAAGQERGGEDREGDRGDAGRNLRARRRHADGDGADREQQRGHAEQQPDAAPGELEDAEQLDVRRSRLVPDADDGRRRG